VGDAFLILMGLVVFGLLWRAHARYRTFDFVFEPIEPPLKKLS